MKKPSNNQSRLIYIFRKCLFSMNENTHLCFFIVFFANDIWLCFFGYCVKFRVSNEARLNDFWNILTTYHNLVLAGKVWYGQGTYFAVKSEYSAADAYSPVAPDGYKRMYMVKVLTGKTVKVQKGYDDRFPPLLVGSTTDR